MYLFKKSFNISWFTFLQDFLISSWRATPKGVLTLAHKWLGTLERLQLRFKLDRVSPVNNKSSTNKLHHFVQKKKKRKKKWHVTCDMWHVTRDTWHVIRATFGGVNILSKFQLPSSYRLWFMILWRSGGKGWLTESMNEWMTRLFIAQPRLNRVC